MYVIVSLFPDTGRVALMCQLLTYSKKKKIADRRSTHPPPLSVHFR